jgi:hypothetical protein
MVELVGDASFFPIYLDFLLVSIMFFSGYVVLSIESLVGSISFFFVLPPCSLVFLHVFLIQLIIQKKNLQKLQLKRYNWISLGTGSACHISQS